MENLTPQEEKAMRTLWQIGDGTVKDILDRYEAPQPPYTTLASVCKNLQHKKYVAARCVGNTYLYTPVVTETDYKRRSLREMVNNYFGKSYRELVSFFLEDERLSREELAELFSLAQSDGEDEAPTR